MTRAFRLQSQPTSSSKPQLCKHRVTRPQSNMAHLIGTQTKLKEMQITILKLALMAQKKHEMEVKLGFTIVAISICSLSGAMQQQQRHYQKSYSSSPGTAGRCRRVWICGRRRLDVDGTLRMTWRLVVDNFSRIGWRVSMHFYDLGV
jgi:hypothetical protein